jgi:thiamine biosynthesis lipoprotein
MGVVQQRRSWGSSPRLAGAFALLGSACACPQPVHVVESWPSMGRTFTAELHMADAAAAAEALAAIREQAATVEKTMGRQMPGSELDRLNELAAEGYYEVQDPGLYKLIRLALDYAQFTRGRYDPTLGPLERLYARESGRLPSPTEVQLALDRVGWDHVILAPEARALHFARPGMELDLAALTRGYALDAANRAFARVGSRAGLLRLDGHVVAWNGPGSATWPVALDDPRSPGRELLTVDLRNRSLAVVGHPETGRTVLLDPRTGLPAASDVLVAVAIADTAADASALAQALFVAGSTAGGELLAEMNRAEAVLVLAGNGAPTLLASSSLRDHVRPSAALAAETGGRERFILAPRQLELDSPLR